MLGERGGEFLEKQGVPPASLHQPVQHFGGPMTLSNERSR